MLEHPGHFIFKKLLQPHLNQGTVRYEAIGKALLNALLDIAAKKLPADLPFSNKQIDNIIQKIKLMPVPKNIINETVYQEESIPSGDGQPAQVIRKILSLRNTTERAIVRVRVPKKRIEEEKVELDEATGEHHTHKIERLVEIDQEDKIHIFPSTIVNRDYSIYALNQQAPRIFRKDLFSQIKKGFADHFEGRDAPKDHETFTKKTEEIYERVE